MASVRTVLRDIADIGLNPHVAYTRCSHDGRLASSGEAVASVATQELAAELEPQAEETYTEQVPVTDASSAIEKKEEKPTVPPPKKVVKPREAPVVKRPA